MRTCCFGRSGTLLLGIVLLAVQANAAVFTVTNGGDAVTGGTLRWALNSANATPGPHTIQFSLAPPYTIAPTGQLPYVTNHNINIDGASYPPTVTIDGSGAGYVSAFRLEQVTNCVVERLKIVNFERRGITLLGCDRCVIRGSTIAGHGEAGIDVAGDYNTIGGTNATDRNLVYSNAFHNIRLGGIYSEGTVVYGNYIGTDESGTNQYPGGMGIVIEGPHNCFIGGGQTGQRNVIMTGGRCVQISTLSTGVRVRGNYLGVDASGLRTHEGADYCVYLNDVGYNYVGGSKAGDGNVIAGYTQGIYIRGGTNANNNKILGNFIGIGADGETVLSNTTDGILISQGAGNQVGGEGAAGRNIIGGSHYGVHLQYSGSISNVIQGNYIGVATNGSTPIPNGLYNILVYEAPCTVIGGTNASDGNVVSGSRSGGIVLQGVSSSNAQIIGNFVGTDATGTAIVSNRFTGIGIQSADNLVGWNVVSGNGNSGISLSTSNAYNNRIVGNLVGVDVSGTVALPNGGEGVYLSGAVSNQIGGSASGEGNIISGNDENGIYVRALSHGNVIENNCIGTDETRRQDLGNALHGIQLYVGPSYNRIEGANCIANNGGYGVYLFYTTGSVIRANTIGTDGTTAEPNGNDGIYVDETVGTEISGNVISGNQGNGVYLFRVPGFTLYTNKIGVSSAGGSLSNEVSGVQIGQSPNGRVVGNIISANGGYGVYSKLCDHTEYYGNYIGVDGSGTNAAGNMQDGLYIEEGLSNIVGGVASLGNVISGNGQNGVKFHSDSDYGIIQDNRIGTSADGTTAIPNGANGLYVYYAGYHRIVSNILSGNVECGLEIAGNESSHNQVLGNHIGTDGSGNGFLGNGTHGVHIRTGSSSNTVGGFDVAERNVIANNGGAGVMLGYAYYDDLTVRNQFIANRIFRNESLGIDLGADGVSSNDVLDPDLGPNRRQNYPVITLASNNGVQIRVEGYLEGMPSTTCRLEFFANSQVDLSGYGQGEILLGTNAVVLSAAGVAGFTNTFPWGSAPPNYLAATATLIDGSDGETSEFSRRYVMDADGDGMPDGFESTYFGNITGGNPDADLDGDGVSNIDEYRADTRPDFASDYPHLTAIYFYGDLVFVTGAPHSEFRKYSLLSTGTLLPDPPVWTTVVSVLNRQDTEYTLSTDIPTTSTSVIYGISAEVP